MTTKEIGDRGEALAAAYLEAHGCVILERNYRFERAEVDLVCFEQAGDGGEIVFVEVKTRSGLGFGHPEEAITEAKKRHLIRAAEAYLYESRMDNALSRFDVISIILNANAEPEIKHFKNAFVVL